MKKIVVSIAALLSVAGSSLPGHAVNHYYVSGPGEQFRGYTVPALVIVQGDTVTYVNGDIASHDVASTKYGPDTPECAAAGVAKGYCRLFWSSLIGIGQTSPVYQIERVPPGTYPYVCTIHGAMKGTLVVLGA